MNAQWHNGDGEEKKRQRKLVRQEASDRRVAERLQAASEWAAKTVVPQDSSVPGPGFWRCGQCTCIETPNAEPNCKACGGPRGEWVCSTCTFLNPGDAASCEMCGAVP